MSRTKAVARRIENAHEAWTKPRYSREQAETMMCLLDAWRDIEDSDGEKAKAHKDAQVAMGSHDPQDYESFVLDFRANNGSFDLRHTLEQLAPAVNQLWDSLSQDQRDSYTFDWEFCPDVLNHAVDWSTRDGNNVTALFSDAKERILAHRAVREQFGRKVA